VELANAGRWTEAITRFREVIAIRAAPAALYALAQAEEHTGKPATAERTYERALVSARASGLSDVADASARALSAIEPRIPRLVIRLATGVDGATATIDGANAPIGEAVKVDTGDRLVLVSAPGRRPFEVTVRVAEGQSLDVRAALDPAPTPSPEPGASPPAAPPPAEPSSQQRPFPVLPVIVGAVGVAAGATGLVLRLLGQAQYDGANVNCSNAVCPHQSDVDSGNAGRTQIIAGNVILSVGAAALVGAAVLWIVAPGGDQPGVRVSVLPWRDGAGASLSGAF
jgi:hypothetical protein